MEQMNMQENARLVLGLRAAGWTEKKINDFILYIETGENQYKLTFVQERHRRSCGGVQVSYADKIHLCAPAIRRRHIRWGIESRH
jgi:hypothetical protein